MVPFMASDPFMEDGYDGSGGELPSNHKDKISQLPGVSIDDLTGKRIIPASYTENLYLPGRILHITVRNEKRYIKCTTFVHARTRVSISIAHC